MPEEKYRLVKALQEGGHVVGMCGDGANDAPALGQAQIVYRMLVEESSTHPLGADSQSGLAWSRT